MNKKAAEMTIGTIIVIILALVVLVVIIYGFSTGWSNLWEKITGFGGGKANVASVVQSCQIACTSSSTYDWCTKSRTIIFDADKAAEQKKLSWTCFNLQFNRGAEVGMDPCNVDCVKKNCTVLSGAWGITACGSDKDVTNQVTDLVEKGTNTYCCRA